MTGFGGVALVPGFDPENLAEQLFSGLTQWILDGANVLVGQIISFIAAATGVDLPGAFATPGSAGHRLFGKVVALSATLLIGFVCLAVLQSLMQGEPGLALRALLVRVPSSIFATVVLVGVTDVLLKAVDGASAAMIGDAGGDLAPFLTLFQNSANTAGVGGAAAFFFALVSMAGAMMCLITLVVRSALIYILVALAPVALAARVWPAASGAWKKLCEVAVALILSKFAIAVALALGAALLGDGSTLGANSAAGVDSVGQSVGKLAGGSVILGLAAFMPFLLLKLIPMAEHAVAAEGAKGGPGRVLNTAGNAQNHISRFTGHGRRGASGSGGGGSPLPGGAAPGGPTAGTTGATGSAAGGASTGGAAAGGAGAGGAAGASAAGAAAGPLVIPVIAAAAAKQGAEKVKQVAAQSAAGASDLAGSAGPPAPPRQGASSPARASSAPAGGTPPVPVKPAARPVAGPPA